MFYNEKIESYFEKLFGAINNLNKDEISKAMELILETYKHEKNIYIFGNGGSSATASHFQNDFNKGLSENLKKKFNFICLNDNIATLMAVANDIGFEEVFRFQLRGKLKEGDIVIAISGSGNSQNVINAVTYAKECGNKVIGMTGYDGGKLKEICDLSMNVPIANMQITEDIHMIFCHLMMSIFYEELKEIS